MTLPRLLAGVGGQPMSYDRHAEIHGERPGAGRRGGADGTLAAELHRAGLRGRGGGGFPLGRKLEAVQHARGRAVVVVNGTEGEPMSVKDRLLLESLPHLVLDGAFCLAEELGTGDVVIALDESFRDAIDAVREALRERPDVGRRMIQPRIVTIPSGYVTGQEAAIVNFVNNGIPRPYTQWPRIAEKGVARRPTLMSNAETLAHAGLIARHGAGWFAELGTDDEAGSMLVTLSGGIRSPGVYEIALGSTLGSVIEAAEGLTEPVRAFMFGGYAGSWVDGTAARSLQMSQRSLQTMRASLGSGIVVALPESACAVAEVVRVAAYMSDQNASQCGPCVNGLASIADTLTEMAEGHAGRDAFGDVRRWAELVTGRGACSHPDGAARFVTSALRVFATEFEDHARHGICDACARPPVLITQQAKAGVR